MITFVKETVLGLGGLSPLLAAAETCNHDSELMHERLATTEQTLCQLARV